MKYILFLLLLISGAAGAQVTYFIRADSTKLEKVGGNNELILKNSTRSRTGAYLKNISNGITGFFYAIDSAWMATDSTLVVRRGDGNDTLLIRGSGISTTPGIDDVLAVGQLITTDRTTRAGNNGYLIDSVFDFRLNYTASGNANYWKFRNGRVEHSTTDGASTTFHSTAPAQFYVTSTHASPLYKGILSIEPDVTSLETQSTDGVQGLSNYYNALDGATNYSLLAGGNPYVGIANNKHYGVRIGTGTATNSTNIRGLRVDSTRQIFFDSLASLSTQDQLIGILNSTGQIGQVTVGTGLSLSSGNLTATGSASTVPISGLTAATAGNTIDNTNRFQEWQWSTLSAGGLLLSSTSTAAAGNAQGLFGVYLTGTNATASQSTSAGSFYNLHDGTGSVNYGVKSFASNAITGVAGYFSATTNTNNYAIIVPASEGSVGIGTSTPDSLLTVQLGLWSKRGVRFSGLAAAANAADSMMVVNATNGNVGYRAIPAGGGTPSLTSTYVGVGDGSNLLSGSANFTKAGGPFNNEIIVTSSGGAGAGIARYAALTDDPGSYSGLRMGTDANALAGFVITNGSTNSGYGGVYSLNIINNVGYPIDLIQGSTIRLDIATGGAVTISNIAGSGSRTMLADANGTISAPVSDETVKESVHNMGGAIGIIKRLRPVTFEYKDGWKNFGEGIQFGFIAQDVQKVLPNSVYRNKPTGKPGDEEGTAGKLGYRKEDLIPILVAAVQEQQREIDALKKRIIKLEKK